MYKALGKSDLKEQLVHFAPLVKKLAHQMKARLPQSVEVDDLIQAGMIGLLDGLQRFEDNQGAQFETYAVTRIRGAMLDELRSTDWLPRSVRTTMRKVEAAITRLQQQLCRAPTEAEVAESLDISLTDYQQMLVDCGGHQLVYLEDLHDPASGGEHFLDRHQGSDAEDPLAVLLESGFNQALVEAIAALPEREKILMGLYYEQQLNLAEIGAVLGISGSRVCQLHSQAIARLRAALHEQTWTGAA
jgi:RNA polymerase sigma factor for flagellar operon FliA